MTLKTAALSATQDWPHHRSVLTESRLTASRCVVALCAALGLLVSSCGDPTPVETGDATREEDALPGSEPRCSDANREAWPADDRADLDREVDRVLHSPLFSRLNVPQLPAESYVEFYLEQGANLHLGTVVSVGGTGVQPHEAQTEPNASELRDQPDELETESEGPDVFWEGLQLTVEHENGTSLIEVPLYSGGSDVVESEKERAPVDGSQLVGSCVAIFVGESVEWSMGSGVLVAVSDRFDTPARVAVPGLLLPESEAESFTLAELATRRAG